jgi:tol-pal system protein YbgF
MRENAAHFLTVLKTHPYPRRVLRLSCLPIVAAALCLCACATNDTAGRQELASLRNEVSALRLQNERLTARVGKLEDQQALAQTARPLAQTAPVTPPAAEPTPSATPPDAGEGTYSTVHSSFRSPPLTVIKLKPRHEPAPAIDTSTDIVEPSADQIADLAQSAAKPDVTAIGDAEYEKGMEGLRTGNLAGGVDRLERFAEAHPKSQLADNALYFAGVGRLSLEDYEGGARDFGLVVKRYPAADSVADALLKLGDCRLKLNQPTDARSAFARVTKDFPGTAAASTAEQRLAGLALTERTP